MESLYDTKRDKVLKFETQEDFVSYLKSIPSQFIFSDRLGDRSFAGRSFQECIKVLETGELDNTDKASKIIDQMKDEQIFSMGVPIIERSVVGFMPNAPAALMGHPKSMFKRNISDSYSIAAPISVYFSVNISASLTQKQILNRGIAALAFVMAMSIIRPVDLYITCLSNIKNDYKSAHGFCVKVNTKPLDLARACYMMTHREMNRRIGFSADFHIANTPAFSSSIPFAWGIQPKEEVSIISYREAFDMQPDDVYIYGGHSLDRLMLNNPVLWVKQMIAKHANREFEIV